MEFKDKVIIVTGASSGIGKQTALHFAKLGGSLVVTGRNKDSLDKVSAECESASKVKPVVVIGDISKPETAKMLVDSAVSRFGKIDVLVNNAGIMELGSIESTSLEQFDHTFNVNVRAIYYLTMLAVPYLAVTKGTIVNVSSVCGIRAFPGVLAYCMSKSAIDQFTACIALELAPKQIRVNAVNPGVIVTELQKRAGLDEATYAKFLERSKETHALGRPGTTEEVADAIVYLASKKSSYITGVTLPVDGGRHAMCPR